MTDQTPTSLWLNLQAALSLTDALYKTAISPLALTVIECHILTELYRQANQHPSTLAQAVGRTAASFTPLLDSLESKSLIQLTRKDLEAIERIHHKLRETIESK